MVGRRLSYFTFFIRSQIVNVAKEPLPARGDSVCHRNKAKLCLQSCSVPRRSLWSAEAPGQRGSVPCLWPPHPSDPAITASPAGGASQHSAPPPHRRATATRCAERCQCGRALPGLWDTGRKRRGRRGQSPRWQLAGHGRVPPLEGSGLGTRCLRPRVVTSRCEPGTCCFPVLSATRLLPALIPPQ